MIINPTSRIVLSGSVCTVVVTGGWYDIYLNGQHYTGTMHLARAAEIFMSFHPKSS